MALTPDEAAQLARLQAKATEPDDAPTSVVVVVENEAPEAPEPAPVPPPVESQADVVLAGAQAQALVIDAQTDAEIRLMDHQAELRAREDERLAALIGERPDEPEALNVVDELLGPVEAALEVDTAPAPSHWFFRPRWGRR